MEAHKWPVKVVGGASRELPAEVTTPHTIYAIVNGAGRPNWTAAAVFGVLWTQNGAKPGSMPCNPAAVALLLNTTPRTVTQALTTLQCYGVVERCGPVGTWANLYLHDPTTIGQARGVVDDPQRELPLDEPTPRAEVSAPKPPRPMLHEHEGNYVTSCSMGMDGGFDAETSEPDVDRMAAAMKDALGDANAPVGMFRDVARGVVDGRITADRVRALIRDARQPHVRSRGAMFRGYVEQAAPGLLQPKRAK